MAINSRDILIYFSIINNGDWDKVLAQIERKEEIDENRMSEIIKNIKCKCLTILDDEYPEWLKKIYKPPLVLFYYGNISYLNEYYKILGVVGSRNYSGYGEEVTKKIVSCVAKDLIIVSGLAKGIDSIAHKSAIDCGGQTIAVLGSGIDICYPFENMDLYNEIKNHHLLISEYYSSEDFSPSNFPMRNRIIAGLCKGLLITEAYDKSGTSITAACAIREGRDVMCVPYPVFKNSENNRMIKNGAYLVEDGNDVLEIMKDERNFF